MNQASENVRATEGVHVCTVSKDPNTLSLLEEFAQVEGTKTEFCAYDTTLELLRDDLPPINVLIIDAPDDFDKDAMASKRMKRLLRQAKCIALCSKEDVEYWQDMVLREEVDDYFVIRPSFDTAYLKVQIWRTVRAAAAKRPRALQAFAEEDESPIAAPILKELPNSPFKGIRALVIEDDTSSMVALRDTLILTGADVATGSHVLNACIRHRSKVFSVIFLDLMLPGVSGSSAIKAVKGYFKEAPIIVTSSYSDSDLVAECLQMGIKDYLIKPIRRKVLFPRLATALGMEPARDKPSKQ